MPYIPEKDREQFDNIISKFIFPITEGQLNYIITRLISNYVRANGLSYVSINDILGVLTATKEEFYRRIAVPYEHQKMIENGDVYDKEILL